MWVTCSPESPASNAATCSSRSGPGSMTATSPSPTTYVPVPRKVNGLGLRATMRRMPGATRSSRPYSKENSRRNGISTAMRNAYPRSDARPNGLKCYRLVVREGAVAMKINLEIDCTPEEMRKFFGLPEVQPLQEALLKEVQERMTANIKAMDAKAMIEAWLPATLKGFEQLQQIFMARMAGGPREKK